MLAIVAGWDAENRVTRYNYAETPTEAKRLVDRLHGLEPPPERMAEMQAIIDNFGESVGQKAWAATEMLPLLPGKQVSSAYYAEIIAPNTECAKCLHLATMWDCDPINKTVSFNAARLTAEHRKDHMVRLRGERNQLLLQSDVNVVPDRWNSMDVATQNLWATYRQALRDLPANTSDPADPIWPTAPEWVDDGNI
jgi:hypothetical protein